MALQKAPIELAAQWAECIAKTEINNNHIEHSQCEILINGTINVKKLKQITYNYLYTRMNADNNNNLDKKSFWQSEKQLFDNFNGLQPGHEYFRYLINRLTQKCNSIQSNFKKTSLNPETNHTEFTDVDWSACQSELLINIINLVEDTIYQSANLTESDISELLLPMSNMAQTVSSEVVERIVAFVLKIVENPPTVHEIYLDEPFSNLAVEYNTKKNTDIDFAIISIIAGFYHMITGYKKSFFREWIVQRSYTTSLSNLGIFSRLLLCIYLNSEYSIDRIKSYEVLTVIYGRVQQGDGLASVLYDLSIALQTKNVNKYLQPEHKLTKLFNRFIQISYRYPDPQIRENCASLVRAVIEAGGNVDAQVINTLKHDVRAKVRRLFK